MGLNDPDEIKTIRQVKICDVNLSKSILNLSFSLLVSNESQCLTSITPVTAFAGLDRVSSTQTTMSKRLYTNTILINFTSTANGTGIMNMAMRSLSIRTLWTDLCFRKYINSHFLQNQSYWLELTQPSQLEPCGHKF